MTLSCLSAFCEFFSVFRSLFSIISIASNFVKPDFVYDELDAV